MRVKEIIMILINKFFSTSKSRKTVFIIFLFLSNGGIISIIGIWKIECKSEMFYHLGIADGFCCLLYYCIRPAPLVHVATLQS
jgi:hypothetical protein